MFGVWERAISVRESLSLGPCFTCILQDAAAQHFSSLELPVCSTCKIHDKQKTNSWSMHSCRLKYVLSGWAAAPCVPQSCVGGQTTTGDMQPEGLHPLAPRGHRGGDQSSPASNVMMERPSAKQVLWQGVLQTTGWEDEHKCTYWWRS